MRTALDFTPLVQTTIGFDRVFQMLDSLVGVEPETYPPCNIEKTGEDSYRIRMAVAGFTPDDISVSVQPNLLVVSGRRNSDSKAEILYRGLGLRPFVRQFQLADYVQVTEARLENGMLLIELERNLPEDLKPRRISIETRGAPKIIEHRPEESAAENRAAA